MALFACPLIDGCLVIYIFKIVIVADCHRVNSPFLPSSFLVSR
jgi:hypothetical protein